MKIQSSKYGELNEGNGRLSTLACQLKFKMWLLNRIFTARQILKSIHNVFFY